MREVSFRTPKETGTKRKHCRKIQESHAEMTRRFSFMTKFYEVIIYHKSKVLDSAEVSDLQR